MTDSLEQLKRKLDSFASQVVNEMPEVEQTGNSLEDALHAVRSLSSRLDGKNPQVMVEAITSLMKLLPECTSVIKQVEQFCSGDDRPSSPPIDIGQHGGN